MYSLYKKKEKHDIVNSFISATNRKLFLEAGNSLQDVVHILTSSEDEELVKALKYVLQISVQKGTLYTSSLSNHVFTLIIAKIYLLILACFPFIYFLTLQRILHFQKYKKIMYVLIYAFI